MVWCGSVWYRGAGMLALNVFALLSTREFFVDFLCIRKCMVFLSVSLTPPPPRVAETKGKWVRLGVIYPCVISFLLCLRASNVSATAKQGCV